jgi:glycerol dehydrogenase-like iron-containing ADH family enzyme
MTTSWPALEKGSGILRSAAAAWRDFAVVTTPSPWALAKAGLPKPRTVILATDLKRETLESLREHVRGASMIVGVGSGLSMDTAKYLAKAENAALAQVLTTSSNNACFTRTAWTFEGNARIPERDVPIPRQLILDYHVLMQAPARMNQAGAAEILCSHTSLFDWRIAHEAGVDVQWDEQLYCSTQDELDRLDDYALAIGAGECDAFVEIIEVGAKFARGFTTHPKARFNSGSEHVLARALEQRSGRRLIHGEAVNLGILLMAHIQGNNPECAADIIRAAKMRFQPEQLGITWPIVERIVMQLPEFARNVPWHTIVTEFDRRGEDGRRHLASRFAAARDFVQRLG